MSGKGGMGFVEKCRVLQIISFKRYFFFNKKRFEKKMFPKHEITFKNEFGIPNLNE